jgi:branched-chain amino acid transport system substrate-binding protein
MKERKSLISLIGLLIICCLITVSIISCAKKKEPETIKIGAILPLTGPAASFGQYVKEGIDLAVEEINKNRSKKFRVIYEDSKGQPQQAVFAYHKLVTKDVKIVIAALSSVASAISSLAEKTNVIQIYVDVVKPGVTDGKYRFRFYPEASQTAGFLASFAYNFLRAKTSAILMINDDYGQSSFNAFKQRFEKLGGKVIFSEIYEINQSDFKNIVLKINNLKQKPDVIYVNGYGLSFVNAIKTLKTFIKDIQIIADVALGVPGNLSQIKEEAEGAYFVDGEIAQQFIDLFTSHYGRTPTSDAGYSYTAIKIISDIIEKEGFGVEKIRKGLQSLNNYPTVMGNITMKKDGNSNLEFVIMQVKNGIPSKVEFSNKD